MEQTNPLTIAVTVSIGSLPNRVFAAWTSPTSLAQWFHMGDGWRVLRAETAARVGGRYRITMRTPAGDELDYRGTFLAVEPAHLLAFTWPAYADPHRRGVVAVTFAQIGEGTDLTLEHRGLETDEAQSDHFRGWSAVLEQLRRHMEGRECSGN